MSYLLSLLAPFRWRPGYDGAHIDDDTVDRLHHRYTTILFVFFCLIISSSQYVGDPLHCWAPGHFTNNYRQYTNKICWVSNTYYLPMSDPIPSSTPKEQIGYYQWVPLFLLAQALFFHLPYLFWSIMNTKSGIDISGLIAAARTIQCPVKPQTTNDRQKTMRFMFRQMDRYVGIFRPEAQGCCSKFKNKLANNCNLICGKKYGNFMVCLYIVTKFLYLVNVVAQFFILDSFLSTDFHLYGALVLRGMLTREDWPAARIFPRTTMCDFTVRALGNAHRHTVQCVLSINFFNEKIYVIVWFWLVLLCVLSAVSLVLWLVRVVFRGDQFRYIKRHLAAMDRVRARGRKPDDELVRRFVVEYLRQDGVLVLRLLNANVNSIIVAEFVADLWEHFLASYRLAAQKHDNGSAIDIV
jgi:hypothetical protein